MSDSGRAKLWAAVLWSAAILVAVAMPGSYVPGPVWPVDKVVHFVLFAGFSWLWMRALPGARVAIVVVGLLYAVLTEVAQTLIPGERTGDPMDALANVVGVAAGVLAIRFSRRRKQHPPHRSSDTQGD